ncbi:hypothetical protein [Burkholderia multivorans]|uniref:hypothetical protein n=1 Tax=Burkholderia multivorans TaxID=87883 RepID=UPI0019D08B0D|nr:hypothetical protein [Burkholderia multivorans]MBN6728503.1 hypothetical protein [Burkholderia multivorans]
MAFDPDAVPCYVVLLSEHEQFALNRHRKPLGPPSENLVAYAKANYRALISIDVHAWDEFARDHGIGPIDREQRCCYILVNWNETEEQLQHLLDL